ncbi:type VI secretion system baseplate subunit TssF [Sphingomonas jatrophae]|uniref:Type VI secretion system protein ImpG n=1 Tax=Sphingomonas jatrophae TaxID=1166337 RepID=A0A1I6M1V0_9SPHN|nr:type VI secretion system baseplate subunit TssF [Sphingomonas jatrophae]SFS09697.1 type VI secretion system protein ImpG [Sphingomonas jatrophae]
MYDEILPYYNSELRFMRGMAHEFAAANPKVASQLRISADTIDDPHVLRLLEGFAFLNARTRMKLDDDFPELTTALLDILYPHYLRPFPSMSIMQLAPQPNAHGSAVLPAGSEVLTEPVNGEPVRFRTGYPVELWPIELTAARVGGLPLEAPHNPRAANATGVLRLSLRTLSPDATFGTLGLDTLRFHIHAEPRVSQMLYELVVGGTISVALADSAADADPVILGREAIRAVGFAAEDVLLPLPAASDPAHALLSEYHGFPDKFLFFDVTGMAAKTLRDGGRTLDLFLYLDRFDPALERLVSAGDFRLFATPVVNLFAQAAEPMRLVPGRFEHRIVPDARREAVTEVYAVETLVVADRAGVEQAYSPFFGIGRARETDGLRYWHLTRRAATAPSGGDDVFVTLVDTAGRVAADADHVASIDLLCTNRNLAAALPFGGGRPKLTLTGAGSLAASAQLISAPTPTLRPRRGAGALWRLVSHLSLGQMSVAKPTRALALIKELLVLHEYQPTTATRILRERLKALTTTTANARAPAGGHIAFITGIDATAEFDDRRLSGSGAFLLGALLDRLFASMAAINAFTRLRLTLSGEREVWQQWPARTGTRTLA